ncbi:MAG: hypothetical protein KJI72_00075 [Patescibacteria group bacterium]|nr:hypothetical protein [Patescibacteria group bacterium]
MDKQEDQRRIPPHVERVISNVFQLLVKHPVLFGVEKRKRAIWRYWQEYDGVKNSIGYPKFANLTHTETIARAIRYWNENEIRRQRVMNEAEKHQQDQSLARLKESVS